MSNEVLIIIAIFLPFLSVFVLAPLGIKLKGKIGWVALIFPVISTAAIITLATRLGWGASQVIEIEWIPRLGINLSFLFDGLSTLYGLIVCGMGILITFYARFYLGEKYAYQNRFYAYLMMFMAAMLGTVFSNNLMLLFISWEMTGLMSFFLIGFLHHNEKSRIGARMALIVTGVTGLMLMVGVVITGIHAGTYNLSEILSNPEIIGANKPWMNVALLFMMLGAFGKSAQFPFFFWLPNAMAAPTPVSAYLHCATMVKLGIFLSARIFPIFVGTDLWGPLLITAGFLTMVIGSVLAYSSHDLKSILAYSTVAQLGFLIGFYGLGTPAGVQHDYFHVLNHVFYKGSLFMIAGIIDHAAGTRDIRKLGGLFKVMPLAGIAFIIMNLSMAGIPGTMGFVSKELVITQLTQYSWYIRFPLMFALFTYAMFMVAFSIRLFKNTFFGTMSEEVKARLHKPSFLFQLPAILPVFLVLLFGLFPNLLGHALEQLSVVGLQAKAMSHLALWHGFNKPLFLSFIIICHGVGFYIVAQRKQWKHVFIPKWLKFDDAFNFLYDKMVYHAKTVTTALLGNSSFNFLPVIIVSSLTLLSGYFIYLLSTGYDFAFGALVMPGQLAIFVTLLIVLGIVGTVFYTTWIKKLIALSVTGFMITFYFILYRAPDLALTQLLIETVSLILVLLFLTRLPKEDNIKNKTLKLGKTNQFFAILSSVAIGVIVFVSILMVTGNPNANPMGKYFIDNTLPLAQGSNAVNTILVDFRGYDTMGEITVLVIALLGVLGLVMRKRGRTSHVARLTSLDE